MWCACYTPAFAGTHCDYLQKDGQAELTWVAGELHTEMFYPHGSYYSAEFIFHDFSLTFQEKM